MDTSKELTHISLCAGYGGIDLGLKRAMRNVRTIAFSEIEAFACANLVSKMEAGYLDAAPIWTDLKTFPWESFKGKVDILSGGFPCQPFSAAGKREGDEDPRHLWPHIVKGIKGLGQPPIVFFENVEGIISSKLKGEGWSDPQGTPVLLHILRELERLGYHATASIFSASEVGAPHQRKRVFILGVSSDLTHEGWDIVSKFIESAQKQRAELITNKTSFGIKKLKDTFEFTDSWPAGRGAFQYAWEPPRVTPKSPTKERARTKNTNVVNNDGEGLQGRELDETASPIEREIEDENTSETSALDSSVSRSVQPSMGGDVDGNPDWLDYVKLCTSVESRTDELRLLGNGVVPATAERAFIVLWSELRQSRD